MKQEKQAMFNEMVTGEQQADSATPGIKVWMNAKGRYQYSIELRYASNVELLQKFMGDLLAADAKIRAKFPVAGDDVSGVGERA